MIKRNANPRKQGDAGLGVAICWFAGNGYTVCVPLTDSQRYDLVVENGSGLFRVSVKTSTQKSTSGRYMVGLRTIGSNMYRTTIKKFDASEYEYLFAACEDGTRYLIPATAIESGNTITLSGRYEKYKIADVAER